MRVKKCLSMLLAAAMVLGLLPVFAAADDSYKVTVDPGVRGAIWTADQYYPEGAIVFLQLEETAYLCRSDTIAVKDASGADVDIMWDGDPHFEMPASDVTVTAEIYNLEVRSNGHGIVTADTSLAVDGDIVFLSVDPDDHYTLQSLTAIKISNGDTEQVDFYEVGDGSYGFTFPFSEPLLVEATFGYVVPEACEVDYIDENGKLQTADAIPLTGVEPSVYNYGAEIHLGAAGQETWYVAADLDYSLNYNNFKPSFVADGPVNLILLDSTSLTGIGSLSGDSFSVYAQEEGTGSVSAGKLACGELRLAGGTLTVDETDNAGYVTVTGGSLNYLGESLEDMDPCFSCRNLTVSGGSVTANGIAVQNVTLSGGSLTLTDISRDNWIRGNLTMTGGTLDAAGRFNGGDIYLGWTELTDSVRLGQYPGRPIMLTRGFWDGNNFHPAGLLGESADMPEYPMTLTPMKDYRITAEQAENGNVVLGAERADMGDTVTLRAVPEYGYLADTVSYTPADGGASLIYPDEQGVYSFTMPNSDVTVSAVFVEDKTAPIFRKQSLVLSGQIGVNFFMDLDCLDQDQMAGSRVVFTIEDKDRATQTAYFADDFKNVDGTLYGFTCYVNSVQMADNIHAEFFLENSSEPAAVRDYSVQEYLESFDEEDGEEINALVKAINDYGYYAQLFLSEFARVPWELGVDHAKMDTVYTQEYTLSNRDLGFLGDREIIKSQTGDVEAVTQSLTLDSGTSVNLFFKLAEGYEGTVEATVEGYDTTVFRTSDGRYRVTIDDIAAHRLAYMQRVTFTTDAGISTVTVCPLSYVYACLNDESENTVNAMLALYDYYVKAAAYKDYVEAQNG